MNTGLLILAVTVFFAADAYEDGRYIAKIKSWRKYYKIAGILFAGVSAYAFLRKYPDQSRGTLRDVQALMRFMPVDKDAAAWLARSDATAEMRARQRMEGSGKCTSATGTTRRSVSETKKKYVAAKQGWICKGCGNKLPAWFEVDHHKRLDEGGTNEVSNLVALCRDCHGRKTAMENMR